MTLEQLQSAMIYELKRGDKLRKSVLAGLVDAVKTAAINKNCRDNITEIFVNEVLLKCKKTAQEMIDTCPVDRAETLMEYRQQLDIINEFAPTLMTDENEIRNAVRDVINGEIEFVKTNKGKIMKIVTSVLKGKVDMKVVSKVVDELLQ